MTELSRLPISTQRRFISEVAREFSQGKIPLHSSILPRYENSIIMKKERSILF